MEKHKAHLYLNNPFGSAKKFDTKRGRGDEKDDSRPKLSPEKYRPQKNRLRKAYGTFARERKLRVEQRTKQFEVPTHIEYIIIHFYVMFNNSNEHSLVKRFKEFGLVPMFKFDHNQSVVFAISDEIKFNRFITLLQAFYNSDDATPPSQNNAGIITLIDNFEFLTSERIKDYPNEDVVFTLLSKEVEIENTFDNIKANFFDYIELLRKQGKIKSFSTDDLSSVEINGISKDDLNLLVENFDILYKAHSLRTPTIAPNTLNIPELTWKLNVQSKENLPYVGVLDTGVKTIAPLNTVLAKRGIDITNKSKPDPFKVTNSHGTKVAFLAAVGEVFFTGKEELTANANIFSIKILAESQGYFNIYDIEKAIREAAGQGIKIFNLSVCGATKNYNASVSEYAFLLDCLSYELDILIFIATGNIEENDIEYFQSANYNVYKYPNHFYNPNQTEDPSFSCEGTNLCLPSESMNNMTVGAIAENLNADNDNDLTNDKSLPAYYTRKGYFSYLAKVNGSSFNKGQMNWRIGNPDIVMPGGDRLDVKSGMQTIGLGENGNDFYEFDSGTSLACPLAANIAAKLLHTHPGLKMQTVKALIINSAHRERSFPDLTKLVDRIKEEESKTRFNKSYDELNRSQGYEINQYLNDEHLYQALAGYGTPQSDKLLYSNDKSVTLIVEDYIKVDELKVIHLNLPAYLKGAAKSSVLNMEATLCFSFHPEWGNQLSYNPLHMSFTFLRSVIHDDEEQNARIFSDKNNKFYKPFLNENMTDKQKRDARNKAVSIKANKQSWSDDFYPLSSKPFSNVQKMSVKIQKSEIEKIEEQMAIAVRCIGKKQEDVSASTWEWLKTESHYFSLVLTLSEEENTGLKESLYDELKKINAVVDAGIFVNVENEALEADV